MVLMVVVGLLVGACCWSSAVGGLTFVSRARGGWLWGTLSVVRVGGWVFVMVVLMMGVQSVVVCFCVERRFLLLVKVM